MLVTNKVLIQNATSLPLRLSKRSFSTTIKTFAPRPNPIKQNVNSTTSTTLRAPPFEKGNHRWSFTVGNTAMSLAILLSLTSILATQESNTLKAEPKQQGQKSTTTKYKKDDVSLLCLIGFPKSGKSTQAENIEKRWGKEGWKAIKIVKDYDELKEAIEKELEDSKGERISLIVDGYPNNWEQAQKVENELCEIFCFAYFHMEKDEWMKRTGKSFKEYQKIENDLKELRENPREKGNILEIVASWPKDEVWEMVEAKVEQIIELREMGEM